MDRYVDSCSLPFMNNDGFLYISCSETPCTSRKLGSPMDKLIVKLIDGQMDERTKKTRELETPTQLKTVTAAYPTNATLHCIF